MPRQGLNIGLHRLRQPIRPVRQRDGPAGDRDGHRPGGDRRCQLPGGDTASPPTSCRARSRRAAAATPWPEMDPEAARDLLANVGFSDGFTSTISFPQEPRDYLPDPNATALALQAQLKDQLGITTTLKPMPFDDLVAAADAGKLEGFYLLGARLALPGCRSAPGEPFRARLRASSSATDSMTSRAGSAADARAMRRHGRRATRGVNDLIRKHVPMIPLAHVGTVGCVPHGRDRQAGERDGHGSLRDDRARRPIAIRVHAARSPGQSVLRRRDRRRRAAGLRTAVRVALPPRHPGARPHTRRSRRCARRTPT